VTIRVTAANGATTDYTVTVYVTPLSSNTNLSSIVVAGRTVVAGDTITVGAGTTARSVAGSVVF
jgi:hypothetical protein